MTDAAAVYATYVAALNAGDVEGVLACFADDCLFEDVAVEAVARGKDELRRLLERMARGLPDFTVAVRTLSVGEGHYGAEVVVSGTLSERVAAGAPRWEARAVSVGQVVDGKIVRNSDYWNAAGFLTLVGALGPSHQ